MQLVYIFCLQLYFFSPVAYLATHQCQCDAALELILNLMHAIHLYAKLLENAGTVEDIKLKELNSCLTKLKNLSALVISDECRSLQIKLKWTMMKSAFSMEINKTVIGHLACIGFYRAMHFSAKRGIAIACRLSVCLSVRL